MAHDLLFLSTFVVTLGAMALFAVAGRARSADDFSVAGRQAGSWNVAGAIMGTLVGGASTIGTVQLAFLFGLSAWWFTLGAGIACLLLALFLAVPLREGEVETVPQFISRYHGSRARVGASLFSALGMFIHIVAQLLACSALLASLFGLSRLSASLISALLVALVALGGGMRSAGPLGLLKLLLLYATMAGAGWIAFAEAGGWSGLSAAFPAEPWFSLFGYGVREGVSDLLSMLVGVVSTQIYLQAIFSAKSAREARGGALLSAVLIPPLGLLGVAVGLYMRLHRPGLDSAQALPAFLLEQLPAPLAGPAFATLLFAAVGTAAGLALGVGTTLQSDVLARWVPGPERRLAWLRLTTLGALLLALGLLLFNLGSVIMQWSFLSMGLRGATICLPLLAAVFLRERTSARGGTLSIILAPSAVIAAGLLHWQTVPPLFLGLAVSALALLAGLAADRWRPARTRGS
ncbi:sodium:solute symporter [Desulfuromonas versatilis]|uniref:Sodium:solute symporter n=1 Tax=Desulfuromonas versatilis TaxID=2802975 RepID=A0ABM8HUS5_9BACT|nr:sodium:solute symporter family protein [Desulfuromonas versatilis]BCR06677.1 sodium:solute symporter [Desulfuromonas versatilis]